MPHANPTDLPNGGGGRWPAALNHFRSVQWGDLEVGYTTTAGPRDCTEMYRAGGLPGGVCMCPHYGYVLAGAITACYPNTGWEDEVVTVGEVYFFPAGHILKYTEPTTHLEFNPAYALQQLMDAIQRLADSADALRTASYPSE
ncbi:hypothetical protein CBI38_05575 [Rhodococcus oxybenzonivorans]|uniref:Uncharacterized protein n=1 Tax=Rhodococcus oxybenzonivorans TaxID=1990687 RepID=A0A2S2BR99_9NOCA|nr:hypothetical protein [Rhodococcus oxybenzonivorans]AWK71122.1 hypothetical protein CBI38_05575 [Rhodococcus oxybenzonivorans]